MWITDELIEALHKKVDVLENQLVNTYEETAKEMAKLQDEMRKLYFKNQYEKSQIK